MGTPVDYAARYWNLKVDLDSGPATVRINHYHLGSPTAAKDRLWSKLKDNFHTQQKKAPGFKLKVTVNGSPKEFGGYHEMIYPVVRPFTGKGTPEACQIVCQLAVRFGEATAANLQSYCNNNLGLDCNGFVGNYLYYDKGGNDWTSEPPDSKEGPEALMTTFEKLGHKVTDISAMDSAKMYVLLETKGGSVVPGGKGGVGHIVITQPNRYMPQSFVFDSFGGYDLKLAKQGVYGNPAYWAVESTGGIGLTESWYAFPKGTSDKGIFRLFRGCKGHWLSFKIVEWS